MTGTQSAIVTIAEKDVLAGLSVGGELPERRLVLTADRVAWYGSADGTARTGELQPPPNNIHTDEEYALSEGLPGAVADGMMSTNWISSILVQTFGRHYLDSGELRTKYIKPMLSGMVIVNGGRIDEIVEREDGAREVRLTVWSRDDAGVLRTEGNASVVVPA